MEQPSDTSWPAQLQENALIAAPEDEFSNFIEFNMQFPDFEGHGPGPTHSHMQEQQQQHQHHPMVHPPTTTAPEPTLVSGPLSTPQYSAPMEGIAMDFGLHGSGQSHGGPVPFSTPSMTPGFCAQDSSQHPTMAQRSSSSSQQHYMQNQPVVPPTPNSIELHGNATRYPQRVDDNSEMYDRYSRMHEEQVCQFA